MRMLTVALYHLFQNPNGYCPDHSTGVSCPVGLFSKQPTAAEEEPATA
jgi:hypothetical protein